MAMQETHEMTRDNLFGAGAKFPVVTETLTIAKSGVLKRGTIVTAAGATATAAADAYAVLAEDVDTTSAATPAAVYLTGEFNANALIVGGTISVADCKTALRKLNIFLRDSVTA